MAISLKIGDRLSYDGAICTIRYLGEVQGTSGSWIGVEWDDPTRGKHDGSHKGQRYFSCISRSPTAASFVRPTRPSEASRSFIAALKEKYTAEISRTNPQIKFSGKVAEEVGFEKIRRKQAQLAELKFAILDGCRIAYPYAEDDEHIGQTCPKILELELSRNLFTKIGTVVEISSELPSLRSVRLNGNRFQDVLHDEALQAANVSFQTVKELSLEETLMTWEEICHVATKFPSLISLSVGANHLSSLPPTPLMTLSATLVSLNLEFNDFTSLTSLAYVSQLKSLRNLHLKGNNISSITADSSSTVPVFSSSVQYLDLSYNQINSWAFVDELPTSFPGLCALRLAHNPIYDNPDPDFSAQSRNIAEEAYMITVGRLAHLKALNFGTISATDRQNAEMFYLARIGKHLSAVPQSGEAEVVKRHKRYTELCELYGPPTVNRQKEINPAFLEARLVTVQFVFPSSGEENDAVEKVSKIPKSYDIYRVKGIAGRLFGQEPLKLRLIWETGEWDPVAGFDDEIRDDSSEEEDAEEAAEKAADRDDGISLAESRRVGKWVKREVELHDGPRQLGFCVDGLEAKIRVEMR